MKNLKTAVFECRFCKEKFERALKYHNQHFCSDECRFWSYVNRTDGCWEWAGGRLATGYGYFRLKGRPVTAHRFAWYLAHGNIPPGAFVCHRCDNRKCANPEHLFLGSHLDNMADVVARKRHVGRRTTIHQVISVKKLRKAGSTYASISQQTGVAMDAVIKICHGLSFRDVII
jgi:hypothetical protein